MLQTQKPTKNEASKFIFRTNNLLWILNGKNRGLHFELYNKHIMGRSYQCDFKIDDDYISRRHSKICRIDNNWYLFDMSSSNGTWINFEQIECKMLKSGDVLTLGETNLLFLEIKEKLLSNYICHPQKSQRESAL